ncbi:MAG: hypothetical protein RIS47_1122 [Bacteroidota bacterium]
MKNYTLLFSILLIVACSGNKKSDTASNADQQTQSNLFEGTPSGSIITSALLESFRDTIDMKMDIEKLSLSDSRIIRSAFLARKGYCFMEADLRGIFSTTTWYDSIMEARFWAEEETPAKIGKITHLAAERQFIDKLIVHENELKKRNFIEADDSKRANTANIVNFFQYTKVNPKLTEMLAKFGFAIIPSDQIQLFHIYEQNDYQQIPNFVTTDMFMQLFHMYFSYVLKTLEADQFTPALGQLCEQMMAQMTKLSQQTTDDKLREIADYNQTFYAIAYHTLTQKEVVLKPEQQKLYAQEIEHIEKAEDNFSTFLQYTKVEFPYSLFKPRGHYTRTEAQKRYFRAMMWLQTAAFCLTDDAQFKRAIVSASVLAESEKNQTPLIALYKAILEPTNFLIGQADNVSILQLAQAMQRGHYQLAELLNNSLTFNKYRAEIKKLADAQNRIKPKVPVSCVDKINFIPQRYVADAEILQELVDVRSETTKRGYPMGLDVMAAFGSTSAQNVLNDELEEPDKWDGYSIILGQLQRKMASINWNETLYNKWIQTLIESQKPDSHYPYFMQTPQWGKKNLLSSLASWAELKHDAILYAEQPEASECGGGGPPDPITVGYVEPNLAYWTQVIGLLDLTQELLKKNKINNTEITRISKSLKENAEFLLAVSRKEIIGQKLTEQEYQNIERIGSTFEWLTIDLVRTPDQYLQGWADVKGPDKSIAIIADVYTSNAPNNPDKGILHVGTGPAQQIYVVVEIGGYLYLTRGAVFSYREFHTPLGTRLTDEQWQQMIEKKKAPEMPEWLKEIVIPVIAPTPNEKIFYSSGC